MFWALRVCIRPRSSQRRERILRLKARIVIADCYYYNHRIIRRNYMGDTVNTSYSRDNANVRRNSAAPFGFRMHFGR